MQVCRDIPYANDDIRVLDLYLPEGEPLAALLYLHGGGLEAGSKDGQDCVRLSEDLAKAGYAVAVPNYRLYPDAQYPDFIEDGALAARWMLDNADGCRLGTSFYLGGSSAGSYLAGMLCFDRSHLARVGLTPEVFDGFVLDAGQPTTHFNVLRERGDNPKRCVVDEAAILYHAIDEHPARPILILYADGDMPCRPEQNRLLAATLKHVGYDERFLDVREMKGFAHCEYDFLDGTDGVNLLAKQVLSFLKNTAH
jgi:acetyl esterase/lipase